jgi:hypothetical protein
MVCPRGPIVLSVFHELLVAWVKDNQGTQRTPSG